MLLCPDLEEAAGELAAGLLPCPSCQGGRLASWGPGREREIRLWHGTAGPAAGPLPVLPPDAHAAACLDRAAAPVGLRGHRGRGRAGVGRARPPGDRPRARRPGRHRAGLAAAAARRRITWRLAHGLGLLPFGGAWTQPTGSALGDTPDLLIPAMGEARRRLGYGPDMTWPLIGQLGLARWLMPAGAG